MYDPGSRAVENMAAAFEREEPGVLTSEQMQTIAFALRGLHPDKSWISGFAACAYLMNGRYEEYARERDRGRN